MISESYPVASGKTAEIGSSGVRGSANAERIVGVAILLPFRTNVHQLPPYRGRTGLSRGLKKPRPTRSAK